MIWIWMEYRVDMIRPSPRAFSPLPGRRMLALHTIETSHERENTRTVQINLNPYLAAYSKPARAKNVEVTVPNIQYCR